MSRFRILLGLVLPLAACAAPTGSTEDGAIASESAELSAVAKLRVVHASPDAPAVDIYVNGGATPVATALAFTETTGFLRLRPGSYTVDVRANPSTAADPVVFSAALTLAGGSRTTAVATGSLASIDPAAAFRILPLDESFAAPGAGNASVRIVHTSPDAPSVSVDVGDDDSANPEIANIDRFADTGAAGVALPAGAPLQIGIGAGGVRQTAFTTPALPDGAGLLVIATGFLSHLPRERDGFGLLAVGPSGTVGFVRQNPLVYALHASPDAPAVRLGLPDGPTVVGRLSFGELSAPLQVPPNAYDLDVFAADGGGPAVARVPTGQLIAGERYLAVAGGFLDAAAGGAPFALSVYKDAFTRGETELQAIHASPDAPAVDVTATGDDGATVSLAQNASFAQAAGIASLALPGETFFTIGVAPAGVAAPVASFSILASPAERSFVLVTGALDPARGASLRLLGVDTSSSPWHASIVLPD